MNAPMRQPMGKPGSSAEFDAANSPKGPPAPGRARHQLIVIEVDPSAPRDNIVVRALYRAFEFAASFVLLVLTLPLLLLQAAVIKLDTPGPAVFVQQRYGRSKIVRGAELLGRTDVMPATGRFEPDKLYWLPQTFSFLKFRTMYHDARQRFPELYSYEFDTYDAFRESFYKLDNDPRVTPAGRWLRRLTVDELPNLWNVVTGKIGLVGPRPENPVYLQYYSADEMKKLTVRPGITGLAVVNGRGNLSIGGQLNWDLIYVRDRSVWMDLKVIFKTAWLVVVRRGAF
jgi:lipopolysaccharide/colanic/teichoic acid biosynthesis glycosyltransferase